MKIDDIEEKEKLLKKYYIDDVNVTDWMTLEKKSKIRFKDRVEYKVNGKLHNIFGPAINFEDEQKDIYYIKGERVEKSEWSKRIKNIKRKIILKKIDNGSV